MSLSFWFKGTVVAAICSLLLAGSAGAQKQTISAVPTTQPGSTPAPRTLSLEDAVQTALNNSKSLRISIEAINRARGVVHESRDALLPSLGATTTLTHLDSGSSATLPAGEGGKDITIPLVVQNQASFGLSANLPLDIAGMIRTAIQITEFQEIARRLDYNRTRNDLVLNVKNAYYDVLRAQAFVTVAEQALKNSQEREKTSRTYLEAGTGTRFDVLRAQTDTANSQQNLIVARNRVNLAIAALNNVLNLDQNTPITTVEAREPTGNETAFNEALAQSYKTRPEVLQADANIAAAEKGVRLANRSMMPTVGLGWNFTATPSATGFSPKTTSWAAVAQIAIPIFDQGISRARREEAHADENTAKLNRLTVLDAIALQVRQAYLALTEAQDRLNVTTTALTQAEEQYRLAQVRYENGVTQAPGASPLLEISDAQTALTQAQNNQVNAQYDVQNSRARLDQAIGRYAFDGKSTPGFAAPTPIHGGMKTK